MAWPNAHNIFLLESEHLGTSLLLSFWISCTYTGNFPSKAGRDEKYHMETVKKVPFRIKDYSGFRTAKLKVLLHCNDCTQRRMFILQCFHGTVKEFTTCLGRARGLSTSTQHCACACTGYWESYKKNLRQRAISVLLRTHI